MDDPLVHLNFVVCGRDSDFRWLKFGDVSRFRLFMFDLIVPANQLIISRKY